MCLPLCEAQYPVYPVFDPFAALLYAPFSYPVIPPVPVATAPTRTAAQSGTWVGTWTSTYIAFIVLWNTGPMTLNIVVDPLLGTVVGTCVLPGSRYANIPFDVSGVKVNDIISVSGLLSTGYNMVLTCLLTSPTTMTGFYVVEGTHIPVLDEGVFNLSLLSPVLL